MGLFELHPRLTADTLPVCQLELCEVRLMNDRRFPWLILVPRVDDTTEVHQLEPPQQQQLIAESSRLGVILLDLSGALKLNLGALGNLVPQLHWHLVARRPEDPCWPGPVWGCGTAAPYADRDAAQLIERIRQAIDNGVEHSE
jgi:diadenosine tetraphosphate (Ap4A) HIT family hydrolase